MRRLHFDFLIPKSFGYLANLGSRQSGISISVIRSITKLGGQLTATPPRRRIRLDRTVRDHMGSVMRRGSSCFLTMAFLIFVTRRFSISVNKALFGERQRGWSGSSDLRSTPFSRSLPDFQLLTQLTDSIGRPIIVDFSASEQRQAKSGQCKTECNAYICIDTKLYETEPRPGPKRSFLVFLCLKFMYPHNGVTKQLEEPVSAAGEPWGPWCWPKHHSSGSFSLFIGMKIYQKCIMHFIFIVRKYKNNVLDI